MILNTHCNRCREPITLTLPVITTECEAQGISDHALCPQCTASVEAALAAYAAGVQRKANQSPPAPSVGTPAHVIGHDGPPENRKESFSMPDLARSDDTRSSRYVSNF